MDSRTFSIQQIFSDRRQYRVPFYQRPYVWNLEDQWARLWEDVQDKSDARLQGNKAVPHFMGAVVLEPQKKTGLLGVERFHIIDGQQRLTTLQYLITALCHVLRELSQSSLLSLAEGCLLNGNPETMEDRKVERFKLWPTFRDRNQYVEAMTATTLDQLRERFPDSFTRAGWLKKIGVKHPPALEAIFFFHDSMLKWTEDITEFNLSNRVTALVTAILTDISIVCISLGEEDDAQVIFETLNGHGAELHATDLIRNFIFMRAGNDADELYTNLWSQFETTLWSENQSRGRLNRPRLEWFVKTAVQAETGDEIDIGRLYAGYRRCVDSHAVLHSATGQLAFLNRYAEHYKALATGSGGTAIGVFGRRIAMWDASSTHALALRVATSELERSGQEEIFDCIESYMVRRAICGLSNKNYNKVFSQLLKKMMIDDINPKSFRLLLAESIADTSRWPSDDEFYKHWLDGEIFPGRLDSPRLRAIFHRLETAMRSEKTEESVPLSLENLDIDHIMPKSWYTYWPLTNGVTVSEQEASDAENSRFITTGLDPRTEAILSRERHAKQIGNLTIVNYSVNRALQNHAFQEKRQAFFEHSHLQLNRALTMCTIWNETTIQERAKNLFGFARNIWCGPN